MPKMKTRKSAVKRLTQTGTGKLMHRHTGRTKLMITKGASRRRRLDLEQGLYKGLRKAVGREVPYGVTK